MLLLVLMTQCRGHVKHFELLNLRMVQTTHSACQLRPSCQRLSGATIRSGPWRYVNVEAVQVLKLGVTGSHQHCSACTNHALQYQGPARHTASSVMMSDHRCLCMLQVAALPPPDVAEVAALDQELLAMEAVLADLQQRLQTEGCDSPIADKQLTTESQPAQAVVPDAKQALLPAETRTAQAQCKPGLPDATVSSKQDSTECCGAQKPGASRQKVAPDHAWQPTPCATSGSLADIDAMMQARGYR